MVSKPAAGPFFLFSALFLIPLFSATGLELRGGADTGDYLGGIYGEEDYGDQSAFPLLKIPLGGRAEGMGSSFTAVADDASFLESNPAGSARIRHTELAFFHSRWITGAAGDAMTEALVFARGFGNLGLAVGGKWLSAPVSEYSAAGGWISRNHYSEAGLILNGAYNFPLGPRFSGLSLGASLKGAFRNIPGKDLSAASLMGDIGILGGFNLLKFYQSPDWNTSVGLALMNLGPPAGDMPLPTLGALGFALRPLRPLLVSFDFFFPFGLKNGGIPEAPGFAAGLEFSFGDSLSLRGGLRVKAESLRVSLGGSFRLYNWAGKTGAPRTLSLDLNYSLDPLFKSPSPHRLGLGFRLGLETRKEISPAQALYVQGLGAYGREDYGEALRCWQEALELDPRFLPASEALAMLEENRRTDSRVEAFLEDS
jgi:hypothetical protein